MGGAGCFDILHGAKSVVQYCQIGGRDARQFNRVTQPTEATESRRSDRRQAGGKDAPVRASKLASRAIGLTASADNRIRAFRGIRQAQVRFSPVLRRDA